MCTSLYGLSPGKTTVIRRVAVQETGVSRYNGVQIEGHAKTPQYGSATVIYGEFQSNPQWWRETPVS